MVIRRQNELDQSEHGAYGRNRRYSKIGKTNLNSQNMPLGVVAYCSNSFFKKQLTRIQNDLAEMNIGLVFTKTAYKVFDGSKI